MLYNLIFFFFNDTATTEIYTLSLHDALPIYLARLVGCCGRAVEEGGEGDGLLDELGVGLRPLVAANAEVVLEADAHVAAEHQAHRGEVVLRRVADAGGGEGEVVAEEVYRRAAHVHELLYNGRVRSHHPEDELEVDRGVEQTLAQQILYVVEVADVVGLQLGLGLRLADHLADPLHVRERVAEDVVAGAFEVVDLPLLVVAAALGDGEETEVEAAGVEGRHLRAELGEDGGTRSEERRVGKECRSRWSPY